MPWVADPIIRGWPPLPFIRPVRNCYNPLSVILCSTAIDVVALQQESRSLEENVPHFIVSCPFLRKDRDPLLKSALNLIPLVYMDHPTRWSDHQMAQLILDPTHPSVSDRIPLDKKIIYPLEKMTRLLCFTLHRRRALTLGYRPWVTLWTRNRHMKIPVNFFPLFTILPLVASMNSS